MIKESQRRLSDLSSSADEFYASLSECEFRVFASKSGLDTCFDVKAIKHEVLSASRILDLGAGYGRVVSELQSINSSALIAGVEKQKKYYDFLLDAFLNVDFYNQDILYLDLVDKFDLVTLLWSTIANFSKNKQPLVFKKVASVISDRGVFVVDMADINAAPDYGDIIDGHTALVTQDNGVCDYLYFPTPEELCCIAINAGFKLIKKIIILRNRQVRNLFLFTYNEI